MKGDGLNAVEGKIVFRVVLLLALEAEIDAPQPVLSFCISSWLLTMVSPLSFLLFLLDCIYVNKIAGLKVIALDACKHIAMLSLFLMSITIDHCSS